MLIAAASVAATGTLALVGHTPLRLAFPLVMLVPALIAMLLNGDNRWHLTAGLMVIYLAYLLQATKQHQRQYREALHTAALLKQRTRELEHISFTDPVTQLRNRSHFDTHFELEWRRAYRQQYSLALLMIDLDHFKRINDEFGHMFGDQCLAAVGRRLQESVQRSGDVLARVGGEEFALLLINTDLAGARYIAQQVCDAVSGLMLRCEGKSVPLSTSVGLAVIVPDSPFGNAAQQFMHNADVALYQAKRDGRNRVGECSGSGPGEFTISSRREPVPSE